MKKKKLVSILLIVCLLLSMLPTSVLGEPGSGSMDTSNIVDNGTPSAKLTASQGETITSTLDLTGLTSNVDCRTAITATPAGSGHIHANGQPCWAWYVNGTTVDGKTYNGEVLVLNGLDVTCSSDTIGLRVPDTATIVTVQGSINTVKAADNANGDSYGIFGEGSLIFDGKGTLNATGGAAANGKSYGIYAQNGVQINGGIVNATGATHSGSGGGGDVTVSFDSAGGTAIPEQEIAKGSTLPSLPVPSKGGSVFIGWYESQDSKNPIGTDTEFTSDIELLARYETLTGNELESKDTTFTQTDADPNLSFKITADGKNLEQVKSALNLEVLDNSGDIMLKVEGSGSPFTVSAQGGFTPGGSYRLTLGEGLNFVEKNPVIRSCEFTIQREEIFNIEFNENLGYVDMGQLSDVTQNGEQVKMLNISPFNLSEDETKVTKDSGTFKLKSGTLNIGDVVCLHSGAKPVAGDDKSYLDDNIAYVKITDVNNGVYTYVSAEAEEVLFLPDVLPVADDADTDGDSGNYSLTVPESVFDFTDTIYIESGLNAATSVDKGDFVAFYTGQYGASATFIGYGRITDVTRGGGVYIIAYDPATQKDIENALNYYSKNEVDPEKLIENIDVKELQKDIAQQAMDSGFAEAAALYLVGTAMETDGFAGAVKGFDPNSMRISLDDGSQISLAKMQTMAAGTKPVLTGLKVKANIGTQTQQFGNKGLRCALEVSFTLTIVGKDNQGIDINVSAVFVEELKMEINASGKAIWKKAWIFPYIADYQLNANLDVFNYTYIKINATVTSKDGMFSGVDISEQMESILEMTDGERIKSGVSELFELYTQMAKTESDWVEIFSKEISKTDMRLLLGVINIRITTAFVVAADMKVALGMEFEYISGDRYCFWLKIKAKDAGSNTVRLLDQKSEFSFYVMGSMGIRAGIGIEIAIGLFSVDMASVGLGAETGAYARLYGYFYYKTTALNRVIISTNKAGALYMELGVYLDISFKAQALGGKYQYSPSLFYDEWPILTAGKPHTIYDFLKADGLNEIKLNKNIRYFDLPSGYFNLQQLDLREGEITTFLADPTSSEIEITSTNPAITLQGHRIIINPPEGQRIVKGTITVRYKNAGLAFTSMPITRTLNVYWDNYDDNYYITFADGGLPSIKAPIGTAVSEPTPPTKAGYTFSGWYTNKELTQPYTFTTMPAENIYLYAKWIPNTVSYRVEHYQEGLKGSNPELVDTDQLNGTTDTKVTPPVKNYSGFSAPTTKTVSIKGDGSTVVRYEYTRNSYKLTFKPGYGSLSDIVSKVKFGSTITPPLMAREGYTFTGWDTTVATTMPTNDLTYTAQWEKNSYNAEFNVDGTKVSEASKVYEFGAELYQPTPPIGYKFSGWYSDAVCKTPFTQTTIPARDIKLFGKMVVRDDIAYKVEHYQEDLSGDGYTLKDTVSLTGITNAEVTAPPKSYEGFTFDSEIDGTILSGTVASDGSLVLKLYYERNSYQITYDLDTKGTPTSDTVDYRYGAPITPKTVPLLTGYTFSGWKTDAAYESDFVQETMPAENITLYGKYIPSGDTPYKVEHYLQNIADDDYPVEPEDVENLAGTTDQSVTPSVLDYAGFTPPVTQTVTVEADGSTVVKYYYLRNSYTITFDINDEIIDRIADGAQLDKITMKYGANLGVEPEAIAKAEGQGYDFAYWYVYDPDVVAEGSNIIFDFETMPAKDVTLKIKWFPRGDTPYAVEHYFEDENGNYVLDAEKTEKLKGYTASPANPTPLTIAGYTSPTKDGDTPIHRRGTTVIKYEYPRTAYNITYQTFGGTGVTNGTLAWGQPLPTPTRPGFIFQGWYTNSTFPENTKVTIMPQKDVSVIAKWQFNPDSEEVASFNLWVGGVQVTSKNMHNITEGLSYATGTASYNMDTYTLTLSNFNLDMSAEAYPEVNGEYLGIYFEGFYLYDLNIELSGTNTITSVSNPSKNTVGLKLDKASVYFKANGTSPKLNINTYTGVFIDQSVYANQRHLAFKNTEVNIINTTSASNTIGVKSTSPGDLYFFIYDNAIINVAADTAILLNKNNTSFLIDRSSETTAYELNLWGRTTVKDGAYMKLTTATTLEGYTVKMVASNDYNYPQKNGSAIGDALAYNKTYYQDYAYKSNYKYVGMSQKPSSTAMNTTTTLLATKGTKEPVLVASAAQGIQSIANFFATAGFKAEQQDAESYGIYTENGTIALSGGTVTAVGGSQAMNKEPVLTGYANHQATASTNSDGSEVAPYNSANWSTYKYIRVEPAPVEPVAPVITTTSLPDGTVGTAYSQTLVATGSTPITWSLETGSSFPAGLTLASNGIISGTPTTTTSGAITFTVKAENKAGSDSKNLTIVVKSAPVDPVDPIAPGITTSSLPDGTVGTAYSQTLVATGDTPMTWSLEAGSSLPAGLNLDPNTGVISGTPSISGTVTFTVKASNDVGSDTKALSITIATSQGSGGGGNTGGNDNTGGNSGGGSGSTPDPTPDPDTFIFTPSKLTEMLQANQAIQIENGLEILAKPQDIPRATDDTIVIKASEIKDTESLNAFYNSYPNEQALRKGYTVTISSENNGQSKPITQLKGKITLKFQLTAEEIRRIDPSTLVVYKESDDGAITTLTGTFDWDNNTLSVTTDHLCNFYLMAQGGLPSQRLSGDNRYETAVAISRQGWKTAANVILTSGADYPDALVAATLAGLKDAPVLLTEKESLNPKTLEEIQRLQAKNIYILGGTGAIAQSVEDQLANQYTIQRIAGVDRYETAVKLGALIQAAQGTSTTDNQTKTVILATGLNYPDALSIAPFAAQYSLPILFTGRDALQEKTVQALKDWGVQKVILIGGTGVIGEAVEKTITDGLKMSVTRLSGDDRYLTGLAIAKYFETYGVVNSNNTSASDSSKRYTHAALATGDDFADALVGAALAGKEKMPLFLVNKSSLNTELSAYLKDQQLQKIYVYGGEAVLSDKIRREISLRLSSN